MRSALVPILLNSVPGWVRSNYGLLVPTFVEHFDEARAWVLGTGTVNPANLNVTARASNETTLLPSSASGAAYQTLPSNTPAIVSGSGLQAFTAATNNLLNSTAPITQTTASLGTGTYTLSVNGSGSATSSAGTAVGSGFGAATNGTINTITLTGAGTVTITVTGSLNSFQLESGTVGTPLVVTTGVTATRAADAITRTRTSPAIFSRVFNAVAAPAIVGTNQFLWALADGGGTNNIQVYRDGAGHIIAKAIAGGSTYANLDLGLVANNAAFKVGIRMTASAFSAVLNGGSVSTGSGTAPTGMVTEYIGSDRSGANQWNSFRKRDAEFSTGLSDAQLQALTT